MNPTEIITIIGVILSEVSYLPQVIHLYRRKKSKSISIAFCIINIIGRLIIASVTIESNPVLSIGFYIGSTLRIIFTTQVFYYRRKQNGRKKNKRNGKTT